ncbi:serine/threonine-protein kinase [Streptomyces sp. NPDC048172]|uniref:serine/threonine-protein kinase n=1 Tax=Streptomyces sp. NPDC048172 TaxID=3365505 RepID=UPI003720A13E
MAGGERGQIVDSRFELLERLGSGGMGHVWRARDTALHREVALKEVRPADPSLDPEEAADSEAGRTLRERVLREARALARLSDPRVVTIHHIVDERPYPWLVMELLPGDTLQDMIEDGPLEPREAARIGRQVLGALRTAHAAGIQHRDVKPANVMLRADGSPVLTDFGIAALQGSSTLTQTGEFLGSPEYIAPERIRGTDDDPSSDLWSLGMLLYVCAEGHSPLRRPTTLSTLAAVLDEPLPEPVRSGPLAPVLTALLVRDVAARPDAEALDRMLADVEEGRSAVSYVPTETALTAPPPPPPGPAAAPTPPQPMSSASPPVRRRSRAPLAIVGAVVAAALIAGGAFLLTRSGDEGGGDAKGDSTSAPATEEPAGEKSSPAPTKSEDEGKDSPKPEEPTEPTDPAPTTKKPNPPKPGAGGPPRNKWVAQLGSVAKSDGLEARAKMQSRLAAKAGTVLWLDSDKRASLRPGYWMFYRPGPFPSGRAAADWCAAKGLTGSDQCVGRFVSDDAADRPYICQPHAGKPTGRCRR